MANIRDIAASCKLSVATVSKALNGYSDVNEVTRARVLDAAKRLGYFPNAQARSLKTSRSYQLGVLFIDENNNGLTQYFFAKVLNSFKMEAERLGYHITFITKKLGNAELSYLQSCRHIGVEGVCLACIDFDQPEVTELDNSGLPLVSIDYILKNSPAILSDNRNDMASMVRYVSEHGHKRIAFVHGPPSRVTSERLRGFNDAMKEIGNTIYPELMVESPYTDAKKAFDAVTRLLQLEDRPTCIFLPDDSCSFGAIEAISKFGLRFPEDVSLVGYDGIRFTQMMSPNLTTMRQDAEGIGMAAARALINNIEAPEHKHKTPVIVSGQLLPGGSVSKIN